MSPRLPPAGRRRERDDRVERSDVDLTQLERQVVRLHNTLRGLAREVDVTVGCPCDRCDRSYLLERDGLLVCPQCGYRRSL